MPQPRCLLIDDHAMFRSGLAVLLRSALPDLEVLEAGSLDESLHDSRHAPDVVLLDVLLRGLNGLDGIDLLKRRWPDAPVIVVSSDDKPSTLRLALDRGAFAFISKEQSADNILALVKRILMSDADSAGGVRAEGPKETTEPSRLTPRQFEVLDLLAQGLPNKAIGRRLDLSENTVRWHVQSILVHLNVTNRSEAAFAARQKGLIR